MTKAAKNPPPALQQEACVRLPQKVLTRLETQTDCCDPRDEAERAEACRPPAEHLADL